MGDLTKTTSIKFLLLHNTTIITIMQDCGEVRSENITDEWGEKTHLTPHVKQNRNLFVVNRCYTTTHLAMYSVTNAE